MNDRELDEQRGARGGENGPPLFLILSLIIAAISVVFVFQNSERAPVRFLFFEREVRIWVALAIALLLGILVDRLLLMWWRRARRRDDD